MHSEQHYQPKEVWIVKGIVTDPQAYADSPQVTRYLDPLHDSVPSLPRRGDPEYRVFDVDPTTYSADDSEHYPDTFLTLDAALSHVSGAIVNLVEDPPEDKTLYDRWESWCEGFRTGPKGRMNIFMNFAQEICDASYEQGVLGPLLDGLEQRR
jgi:hypothetical protein